MAAEMEYLGGIHSTDDHTVASYDVINSEP
jgi:hypothetical protein